MTPLGLLLPSAKASLPFFSRLLRNVLKHASVVKRKHAKYVNHAK
jgi:hypothetical protein